MKSWIRFRLADGHTGFGVLENHRVTEYEGDMFGDAVPSGNVLNFDAITLLSPCVPTKVVALWNNFHSLSEKLGKSAPSHPLFLIKPPLSVIGPGEPIPRPKGYSGKIAYEGELAIMIFSVAEQVSLISHDMTLMPGDVIACGTSIGVGSIKDGSTVHVSIDGIGTLSNTLSTRI